MRCDAERRRLPRVVRDGRSPVAYMRLRTGAELTVLNLSATGALVESTARLLPGSTVDIQVGGPAGRIVVRTVVVRSTVSALAAGRIEYRSGLAFAQAIDLSPPAAPSAGADVG